MYVYIYIYNYNMKIIQWLTAEIITKYSLYNKIIQNMWLIGRLTKSLEVEYGAPCSEMMLLVYDACVLIENVEK
jgi:hypothetical protein